jgi:hypothetical protein
LFQLSAASVNPWVRAYYQRLRAVGKPANVPVLVAMRKLLATVYSVATHRRPFTLAPIFSARGGRCSHLWRLASRNLYASVSETFLTGTHGI